MRLRADNPHLAKAITIHPRTIKDPTTTAVLKSVSMNSKMGKGSNVVAKGKWAGMPMYQLSLEERKTCPHECERWDNCYGNNMRMAHRIDHTHPEFMNRLEAEIEYLARKYRHGVVIRPHVIGDFFSDEYAQFWMDQASRHKSLHLFGFTHHKRASSVGKIVSQGNENERVWIRFSDQGGEMSANVLPKGVVSERGSVPCPQQTGKSESCLTCGVCWSSMKAVTFQEH